MIMIGTVQFHQIVKVLVANFDFHVYKFLGLSSFSLLVVEIKLSSGLVQFFLVRLWSKERYKISGFLPLIFLYCRVALNFFSFPSDSLTDREMCGAIFPDWSRASLEFFIYLL